MELKYYIVEGSVLPEVFKKVVDVKKLLETDMHISINDACNKLNISRSTYYKYKNSVYEFYENTRTRIVTFSLSLKNEPGILSRILDCTADSGANILTINQNIPVNGIAIVAISIETIKMKKNLADLVNNLKSLDGVKKVEILSRT
ncbi:MAG: ACT domain-containing protein [Clostridiales bacterium]|nr:ACT domain-containing protein [Clostridiales bacterium]HBM80349.1 ACT domain-containing protein [Clostridiaceae bacterium]